MRQLENGGHAQSWLYGDGDDDRTRNEAMAVHDRLADKYADKQARSAEAQRRLEEERGLHAPLTGGSRYRRCVALLLRPLTLCPAPPPRLSHGAYALTLSAGRRRLRCVAASSDRPCLVNPDLTRCGASQIIDLTPSKCTIM